MRTRITPNTDTFHLFYSDSLSKTKDQLGNFSCILSFPYYWNTPNPYYLVTCNMYLIGRVRISSYSRMSNVTQILVIVSLNERFQSKFLSVYSLKSCIIYEGSHALVRTKRKYLVKNHSGRPKRKIFFNIL